MTKVQLLASTATPDPRAQREPTALYRLYGADETLLYVGISADPDRRFKQHRDTKPWWPQVTRKNVEWHPSRSIALAEEAAAIKAEAPAYNIEHNPAMASYCWPPAGMPADRVDTIEREASALPADLAEGIRRAAFEEFTRTQRDRAAGLDRLIAALSDAVDQSMRTAIPHLYTPEKAAEFTAAMIAELRNPQTAAPAHYPWCETAECTSHRYDDGEVLTEHLGAKLMMPVPEGLDCYANELLFAQLGTDENHVDATPAVSFNSGGNGVLLNADELDKVIGDLAQFTDGLRAMRQQMTAEPTGAQA